jgi:hypothetical protein
MSLDDVSVWWILIGTMGLVLLCLEVGIRMGRRRQRSGKGKLEMSGAMVGAVLGLLSFLLAFTFNGASTRHEARKALVIEETNAIETTWLRAGLLAEPAAAAMRGLLRDYVDVRLKAVMGGMDMATAIRESERLHAQMWALAQDAGRREPGSITTGLLIQSLNEVIDIHLKRLTTGVRARVLGTIWATLYLLLAAGMAMVGMQIGQSEGRHFELEVALAVTFSMVLFLIANLDRPQEGLLKVSQQAMSELQAKLHAH